VLTDSVGEPFGERDRVGTGETALPDLGHGLPARMGVAVGLIP
jgi:hypothetical protein